MWFQVIGPSRKPSTLHAITAAIHASTSTRELNALLEQNETDLNLANLAAAVSWLTEELMRSQRDMLTERNRYKDIDDKEDHLSSRGSNPAVGSLKGVSVEGISDRQLSNGSATTSCIGFTDSNRRFSPRAF